MESIFTELSNTTGPQWESLLPNDVTFFKSNVISLVHAIENESWIGQQLAAKGLTPETAYPCLMRYLLEVRPSGRPHSACPANVSQPHRETRRQIGLYQAVLAHSQVLSVALQIRTGDNLLFGGVSDERSLLLWLT